MWLDQYKDKKFQTNTYDSQDSRWVKDLYEELKQQEKLALDEQTKNSLNELKLDLSLELAYILEYGNWYLVEKWDTLSHINALLPEWFSLSIPDPKKLQSGKQIRVFVEKWIVYVKRVVIKDKKEIEIKEQISWSKIVWWTDEKSKATYQTYRLSRWATDCEMQLDEENWKFIAENWELIIPIDEVKSLEDLRAKTQDYREKKADEKALSIAKQLEEFDYNIDSNEYFSNDWKIVIPRELANDLKELKGLILVKREELLDNQAIDFASKASIIYKKDLKEYFISWYNVTIPRDNIKSLDDLMNIINIETERYLNNQWKDFALKLWIDFDETKKAYIIPNMNATILRDDVKSFEVLKVKYDEIISRQSKPKLEFFDYSVKSWDWMIKIIINNWQQLWLESNSRKNVLDYYDNNKKEIVESNGLKLSKNWDPIILLNSSLRLPVLGSDKSPLESKKVPSQEVLPQEKKKESLTTKDKPITQTDLNLPKEEKIYSTNSQSQPIENEKKSSVNETKTKVEIIHTQEPKIESNASEKKQPDSIKIESDNQTSKINQNQTPLSIENETEEVEPQDAPKQEDENSSIFDMPNFGIFNKIKKYTIKQQEAIEWNVSIIVWHEDASIKNKDKPKLVLPKQQEKITPPKIDILDDNISLPKTQLKVLLRRSDMNSQEIQLEKVYSMRNLKHGYSLNQFHPETVTKTINDNVYMLTLDWANIDQYLDKDWNMIINVSKLIEHSQFDYSALTAWYIAFKVDGKVTLYKIKEITNNNDIIIWDKLDYFSQSEYEAYKDIDKYHKFISKYDSSIYRWTIDSVWLDEMLEQDLLNVKFLFDLFMKRSIEKNVFEKYLKKVVEILPDQIINWKLSLSWEYFTEWNLKELSRFWYNTNKSDLEIIGFNNQKNWDYYRSNWIIPLCEPNILNHSISILKNIKTHKWAVDEYKWDLKIMWSEITYLLSRNKVVLDLNYETSVNDFVLGLKSFVIEDKVTLDLVTGMINGTLQPLDENEQQLLNSSIWSKTFTKEQDFYDNFVSLWIPEFSVKKVLSFANRVAKNEEQLNTFIMRLYLNLIKSN